MRLKLRALLFLFACIASGASLAQSPSCPFYAYNPIVGNQCFLTLGEAEAWMRKDSPTDPTGRAFLVGDETWMQVNDAAQNYINLRYKVRPRAPERFGTLESSGETWTFDGSPPWLKMECSVGGVPKGVSVGSSYTCTQNPDACTYSKLCQANVSIRQEILDFAAARSCDGQSTMVNESSGPSSPVTAGVNPAPNSTQPSVPEVGHVGYQNFNQGLGTYHNVQYKTESSPGNCNTVRGDSWANQRYKNFFCPKGLRPQSYFPSGVSVGELCASGAQGTIQAYNAPAEQ